MYMIYLKANLPTGMLGYFEIGDAIELFHWEYSHITWMGRNRVYGAISSRTILNIRYSIRVMNFLVVFHLTNLRVSKTHCKIYEPHWFRITHDTESLWQRHPIAPLTLRKELWEFTALQHWYISLLKQHKICYNTIY